jgi:hypothetical protein
VLLFGGNPDITISDYCGRYYPTLAKIINKIFFWQRQHCLQSREPEEKEFAVGYYWLIYIIIIGGFICL